MFEFEKFLGFNQEIAKIEEADINEEIKKLYEKVIAFNKECEELGLKENIERKKAMNDAKRKRQQWSDLQHQNDNENSGEFQFNSVLDVPMSN